MQNLSCNNRYCLDDEIIQETPDVESQIVPPEKKQKFEDDVFGPSPDLFEDDTIYEIDVASIPPIEQNYDQENSIENPPSAQLTPPNPFFQSIDCSEKINIQDIIDALVSQPSTQVEQQKIQQSQSQPVQQEQQQSKQPQQHPNNDLPFDSMENLTVEKLLEELSSSNERINKLLDEVKKSS